MMKNGDDSSVSQRYNVTLACALGTSKEKSKKRIPFIFSGFFFVRKYELRYYYDDAMKHLSYSCIF